MYTSIMIKRLTIKSYLFRASFTVDLCCTECSVLFSAYTTPVGYVECCQNTSNTHLCFTYHMKGEHEQVHGHFGV